MTLLNPKISIITPCLNRVEFIRTAIESVLAQNYQNFEHIIIDGGSTDGTLELLKKYQHVILVSEPDKNLYEAINKGIRLASGKIIGHLNSDDFYSKAIFGEIARIFLQYPEIDVVCGRASVFEDNPETNIQNNIAIYKEYLSIESITLKSPIINAKFFNKSLYENFGLYNTNYSIASDREFLLRIAFNNAKAIACDKIVYNYRQHPGSLTIGTSSRHLKIKTNKEYLQLSESYLKKYKHMRDIKNLFTKWHTKISIHLLVLYIRQKMFIAASLIIIRGLKFDIKFPICLVFLLTQSILIKKG